MRINIAAALCALLITTTVASATEHIDTVYKIGVNWQGFDTTLAGGRLKLLFADTLGFNMFHGWYNHGPNNNAISWKNAQGGTTKLIVADIMPRCAGCASTIPDTIGPIQRYSGYGRGSGGAEFMKYEALPRPSGSDTLTHYYFIDTAHGNYYSQSGSPPWTHFEIPASASSTSVIVLSNNEILVGAYPYDGMWSDGTDVPLELVVKMNVGALKGGADPNYNVISIKVMEHLRGYDGTTIDRQMTSWNVPWSSFATTNDAVLFSPTFYFPIDPRPWVNGYGPADVKITVSSERHVTTRIAWVTMEDLYADSLLSGTVLVDPTRSDLRRISDTVVYNTILNRADSISNVLGSNLYALYLTDEPHVAAFQSQARVTEILKTHGYLAETERGNPFEDRYAAIVKPQWFRSGSWGATDSSCAAVDSGPSFGRLVHYDDSVGSNHSVYKDATVNPFKIYGNGYFPFKNLGYVSASTLALERSYTLTPASGSWNDATRSTDYSFDPFDYSMYGWRGALQSDIEAGLSTASLVYLNPPPNAPKEWVPNIFMSGYLNIMYPGTDANGHVISTNGSISGNHGGSYWGPTPAMPEQLNAASFCALALGAKGLFYWTSTPWWGDTTSVETGLTNELAKRDSDWYTYAGNRVPTMNKRNCLWMSRFSAFLAGPAQELYKMKWIGAVVRNMRDSGGKLVRFERTVGLNTIVNASGDSTYRHALTSWVPTDAAIASHDTLLPMPDSLAFVAYGIYTDTTAGVSSRYYLAAVNLWSDPRNLRCKWVDDADSAINGKYIKRGDRIICTKLKLDSTIARYWRVSVLDTTKWDTLFSAVSGTQTLRQRYARATAGFIALNPPTA